MYGMKGLRLPLRVEPNREDGKEYDGRQWKLIAPLVYETKDGIIHTVPIGFVTDFATWIKPTGRYQEAAVVHDYLYYTAAGRKYADHIFKEMMERGGCTRARVNMMYYGVRCFGWWAYYISPMLKRK